VHARESKRGSIEECNEKGDEEFCAETDWCAVRTGVSLRLNGSVCNEDGLKSTTLPAMLSYPPFACSKDELSVLPVCSPEPRANTREHTRTH
jgi:hypothetical protein